MPPYPENSTVHDLPSQYRHADPLTRNQFALLFFPMMQTTLRCIKKPV